MPCSVWGYPCPVLGVYRTGIFQDNRSKPVKQTEFIFGQCSGLCGSVFTTNDCSFGCPVICKDSKSQRYFVH